MTISKVARVAALMIGGSVFAASPALAQRTVQGGGNARPQQTQQQQQGQPNYQLSRAEQAAFAPLMTAYAAATNAEAAQQTADWAAVRALLPAAQAAARGPDALWLVARVQLSLATDANDIAGQEAALATLVASPSTRPADLPAFRNAQTNLLNARAEQAFQANDFATAERLFRQLLQANPSDTRLQNNLRVVMERMGNTAGALEGIEQQITAAEANGGRAPETLYRQAFETPMRARQRPAALTALVRLVRNYPTPANWRTAVDFARAMPADDTQLLIDVYRLARTTNVLQPNEYAPLANTLAQGSYFAEAQAVIAAAEAAGAAANNAEVARVRTQIAGRLAQDRAGLDAEIRQARTSGTARQARNVADALVGYQRYAEAAELYRVALTKGGEDANLINTRLGAALALAGQRAEAETALRAVTGQRAELAALWLAWLDRRPS